MKNLDSNPERFEPRVVPSVVVGFIRSCQQQERCVLGGGAALAGAWLGHRRSRDIDLFLENRDAQRALVQQLSELAMEAGGSWTLQRDAGTHVRGQLDIEDTHMEVDVVVDSLPPLDSPLLVEGVQIQSLMDLRASKLTCLLSRVEPRDLVDVMFLDRAGFAPEADLKLALQKDAGTDPVILAWLLTQFRTSPLPEMLEPLTEQELDDYRRALLERIKNVAR